LLLLLSVKELLVSSTELERFQAADLVGGYPLFLSQSNAMYPA